APPRGEEWPRPDRSVRIPNSLSHAPALIPSCPPSPPGRLRALLRLPVAGGAAVAAGRADLLARRLHLRHPRRLEVLVDEPLLRDGEDVEAEVVEAEAGGEPVEEEEEDGRHHVHHHLLLPGDGAAGA